MKNPSIVFTAPAVAEFTDYTYPEALGAHEVRLRLMVSTISAGTERAVLDGKLPAAGYKGFPRQSGYSAAAIVDAVGEAVTRVKVGDRVAASWTRHSMFYVLPESQVYPLPEGVSFAEGALVHIATFPLAAIRKCRLEIGESAIVMGLGVLGLIGIELLKAAGAVPIIAVDPVPEKRTLALSLGADYALDPFAPDFAETVKSITNGGAKVALEVTGVGAGLNMVLDCIAPFARVALLGCTRDSNFTIDYYGKVHARGVSLIGAHTNARPRGNSYPGYWTEKEDAESILLLANHGRIHLSRFVEETHSPTDAPMLYKRLLENRSFPIVQFDWSRVDENGEEK